MIAKGVQSDKIVIGKPATSTDADTASYMSPTDLKNAIDAENQANGWRTGVMIYELSSDLNGAIMREIVSTIDTWLVLLLLLI